MTKPPEKCNYFYNCVDNFPGGVMLEAMILTYIIHGKALRLRQSRLSDIDRKELRGTW